MNRLILFLCVLLCACSGAREVRRARVILDDVASYINERPDSALVVLQGVDSTALTTRALQAKYTLLRVMALDKNYKDIDQPGLLDPAIRYYSRHGSADERLKIWYYQGRIKQHEKDLNGAAIAYSTAEEYIGKATDAHAIAILYDAFASVYNLVYNPQKQQEYLEKALAVLHESGDPMYGSVMGELALVYHTKKEWARADSLYREAITCAGVKPYVLSNYLSNYARMKVLQPEKDPAGTIDLLDRKRSLSGGVLTPKEAGAYAYALALMGKKAASESLRARLDVLDGKARYDALPWLARMAVLEEDWATAYRYQEEVHISEESLVAETLTDSITQALREHAAQQAQDERENKIRLGLWALAVIAILVILALLLLLRGRRIQADRDRLMSIRMSLEQDLSESEARSSELSSEMSSRLDQLRNKMQQERLERLRKNGNYGYWLWMEDKERLSNAGLVRMLRKDLREICKAEKDTKALARRLDMELDGLVSHLKKDLGLADKSDQLRLLCYWLVGLKPDMVAELLNITVNNVYVREHRLQERIRQLDKAEYAFLTE